MMQMFITRIANESAMEFSKRRSVELGEAERMWPRAEKVRDIPSGFTMIYRGENVAYFADK